MPDPVRPASYRLPLTQVTAAQPRLRAGLEADGKLFDVNGVAHSPDVPLERVPAFEPEGGRLSNVPIIYVNGILDTPEKTHAYAQRIANIYRAPVIRLYSATEGVFLDAHEALSDSFRLRQSPCAAAIASICLSRIADGKRTRIVAMSQGAILASHALSSVEAALKREGVRGDNLQGELSQIELTTFGGAARSYEAAGPVYNHYVNRLDPITVFTFWAGGRMNLTTRLRAGQNANIHRFNRVASNPHTLRIYLDELERQFEAAGGPPL